MSIEVKQMIIKSTVLNDRDIDEQRTYSNIDIEQLKEMLMAECRELIAESLSRTRER